MSPTDRGDGEAFLDGVLDSILRRFPGQLPSVAGLPFDEQISATYSPSWGGVRPSGLLRAAFSYRHTTVPVQSIYDNTDLRRLLNSVVEFFPLSTDFDSFKILKHPKNSLKLFKPKRLPQALTKANLYLDEVLRDLCKHRPTLGEEASALLWTLRDRGITHDAATAIVLYGSALSQFYTDAFHWAATAVLYPKLAKAVSNFLKATGGNATSFGSLLVECEVLQGRGVGTIDLLAEAKLRCDAEYVRDHYAADFDGEKLRRAVRRIYETEISHEDDSQRVEFPTLDEHWDSRWVWAVNGSQSSLLDGGRVKKLLEPLGLHKLHRRAWLECTPDDPRVGWDGTTYVSPSPKLENGKTRAIFACDTRHYLAFEHLLTPVEKRWRGSRVVLNPGKGGNIAMAQRVRHSRDRSGISLMLDYDDFNSQHTTAAMKIVIEELCSLVGYPADLAATLVSSFDKMRIHVAGKYVGTAAGTLMSGHRATTFINSVLNKAYLDVVLGESWLDTRRSVHVGDDIYCGVKSYRDAAYVVHQITSSPLRMNPTKQSVGHVSTEFLRLATAGRDTYGYVSRSIASLISGNWVSDRIMNSYEALTTMVASARTLANRARDVTLPLLLESAVKRVLAKDCIDDRVIRRLLLGEVAINNGPTFSSSGSYTRVTIRAEYTARDVTGRPKLPHQSTSRYLTTNTTDFECETLSQAGISPEQTMIESSYAKSLRFGDLYFDRLVAGDVESTPARGSVGVEWLVHTTPPKGVLSQYPLLVLVKSRLPEYVVRDAAFAEREGTHSARTSS
nr:RNA-dependent RNA polymerase [Fusarium poae victorivirus 1]